MKYVANPTITFTKAEAKVFSEFLDVVEDLDIKETENLIVAISDIYNFQAQKETVVDGIALKMED